MKLKKNSELKNLLEAIVFLSQEPISPEEISKKLGVEKESVENAFEQLEKEYRSRGIDLKKVAGGYKFYTNSKFANILKDFVEEKPVKLSKGLLEVLAIIAFRQPITKREIWKIRGHNPDGAIKSLLEKGLIEEAGRAKLPGGPKLYRTTKDFLRHFHLNSLEELKNLLKDKNQPLEDSA